VDEQVDHGPIIIQSAVPIYPDDDEVSLSGRILREEHRIFPLAVKWFAEGRVRVEGRRVVIQDSERPQFSVTNPGIS
jgi:phosphoribosylglycinamide formyltransferase-1